MPNKKKEYFDTKYIIAFQNGDLGAFDIIFNHYKNHVYWMGISFFSNEETAKDLVQAVFLEVYQSIKKLREPEKFYLWMNRITYTRCLQMVRYNKKDSTYYTNDMGEDYMEESVEDNMAEDVLSNLQKEHVTQIIIDTLETLPADQRTVCYLRLFEELSWLEIQEVTNIPVGTASSYLTRIKPVLKKALEKKGFTSISCMSLLLLPNLVEYYKAFVQSFPSLSESCSQEIFTQINSKKLPSVSKFSWKLPVYSIFGAAIALPIIVNVIPRNNTPILLPTQLGENAQFASVSYAQQLTNMPFEVYAETTNENYDEILLNNSKNLMISENGNYELTLVRNSEVIDTKKLTITNIDQDVPLVTSVVYEKGIAILTLSDEHNAVDFDSVELYEDGMLTNNFILDKDNGEIRVSRDISDNNLLMVSDSVGNILEVNITFFEVFAE